MPIAPAPPSAPIVAAGASRRHYPRRSPAAATRWSGPLRALGLLGLLGIVASTFLTAAGDPYHEITRIAGETRADAIVVGASLKAGHRLMGSLAVRLVRAGKWPVTVVP